jgi:tRNA A-37 threonylcarbamoyl transferase component Bud32
LAGWKRATTAGGGNMAAVHAIGLPENESERKAITYLAQHLPGEYHIFHNLELLAPPGLAYEYDMVVVGEYAVYAVEVKGYQGHIRGNAYEWELESGAIRRSPIPLANKKAKVLASFLRSGGRLQGGKVWVQPLILMTDDQARVRLNDAQAERVLRLDQAVAYILNPGRLPTTSARVGHLIGTICDIISRQFRPLRRQREIGDYQVLETIGRNNLYTTWLARHRLIHTRDRFVLKVYHFDIYASSDERRKQRERILRDAEALHRLAGHSNIVRAHLPFPWQNNQIVLPLEWIDGYSLRGLLDTDEPLRFARKIDIVRQVCEGLAYAHRSGVIHRDVRPDNVIVPVQGPVKLVNFDCARVEGDDLRTIATRLGRQLDQRYVAPEVWLDPRAASPASDLYSAGTILFELLTGRPPYQKIREVIAASGLPSMPTQIEPDLPSDVDEVVSGMCAFRPRDRYENLAQAVEYLAIIG